MPRPTPISRYVLPSAARSHLGHATGVAKPTRTSAASAKPRPRSGSDHSANGDSHRPQRVRSHGMSSTTHLATNGHVPGQSVSRTVRRAAVASASHGPGIVLGPVTLLSPESSPARSKRGFVGSSSNSHLTTSRGHVMSVLIDFALPSGRRLTRGWRGGWIQSDAVTPAFRLAKRFEPKSTAWD